MATRGQLVRIYQAGRHIEIIIPDDYARALDSTRRLRAALSGNLTAAANATGDELPIDIDVLGHALPEHFRTLIGRLPDPHPLTTVVLLNHPNPDDPHHREAADDPSFVSAASARNGTITFFSPLVRPILSEEFLHEAAHLYGEQYEGEMRSYRIAAGLEPWGYAHRPRAKLSVTEDWAVHLGECVLGGSAESFKAFGDGAPLRAAVIGLVMRRLLNGGADATTGHRALVARSHHLNSVVRARAVDALRATAQATSDEAERNRAIQLLLALLDGEPLTGFAHLASLNLSDAWLGRVQMQSLRGLHALHELDLSGTLLGRGSLEFLTSLSALRILSLRGNDLWTSDMEDVCQLPALESLDIGQTRVNGSAIVGIGRIPGLRVLRIDGTELADSAEELRVLLPECDVQA